MVIWTLAKKDLRLLVRDARALIILLAMPLIFILVLGMSLGENFGQKPSAGLRVSVLILYEGVPRYFDRPTMIGNDAWSKVLLRDLNETADIRVEFTGPVPKSVHLEPGGQALKVRQAVGLSFVIVPRLELHGLVVGEYE